MKLVSQHRFSEITDDLPIDWEEPDCPLCAGKQWEILLEAQDPLPGENGLWFAIVQCQHCGLCFTNPRPSPKCIGRFYPESYRPHVIVEERSVTDAPPQCDGLPRWLARKHGHIALPARGNLLDFGCGGGRFLQQMRQLGWNVTGVDMSATTAERLRQERSLRVFSGSLPHPELETDRFDLITMWHSLEHVHQPRRVLAAAHDLLAPQGKLIVAVPNIDSLPYRWFGAAWYALDVPRHLTHFSAATLVVMLEKCGFELESLRMVRHSSWLRMSAQRACQMKRNNTANRLLQTRFFSRLACWYSCFAGLSDAIVAVAVKA